jgi:PAS domain S-box-containing protein
VRHNPTSEDERARPHPGDVIGGQAFGRVLDETRVLLASSREDRGTLAEIPRLAVPGVADWCAVDVVEAEGSIRRSTSGELDVDADVRASLARGLELVIRTGEPALAEEVGGPSRASHLIVPLCAGGRAIGALTLLAVRHGRSYGDDDVPVARRLAELCAVAAERARTTTGVESSLAVLDATFATAPVGLGLLDRELRFVRVNDRLAALNGRSPEEHIGKTPAFVGPAGAERTELFRRILATGEPLIDLELPGNVAGTTWLVSGTPVPGPDGEAVGVLETVIDVTERRRLLEAERAARRRAGLLARTAEDLERSLDLESTLRNVATVAVPEFCDWCAVFLADEDTRTIRLAAVTHADPAKTAWVWRLQARYPPEVDADTGPSAVVRTGRPEVVNDVTDAMLAGIARSEEHLELLRNLGVGAAAIVPLSARGRTLGAIVFVLATPGRRFGEADVELARDLGRRAGMAVDNARLYTARAAIAHTLQARLLPSRLPVIPGVKLAARYRAAGEFNEVGGDFYDVMPTPDGDWILAVGDVTGKGADAAAVTALARYTLRAAALHAASPSAMLLMLNDAMLVQNDEGQFCTVCVARLRRAGDRVAVSLALGGHEPALVLRAEGRVEPVGDHGTLIGLLDDPALADVDIELDPGDVLVLYTDGVTDAGAPHHAIGPDGLVGLLEGLRGETPERILDAVEQAAVHVQEGDPRDDIALLAVSPEEGMTEGDPGTPSA